MYFLQTNQILMNEFPPKHEIKPNIKIVKQVTEIVLHNWKSEYYI
jgi:hypothetical protein